MIAPYQDRAVEFAEMSLNLPAALRTPPRIRITRSWSVESGFHA